MLKYLYLGLLLSILGCQSAKIVNMNMNSDNYNQLDYLEEIEGTKALQFAKLHNEISDKRLKSDERYAQTYKDILKIVSAKDKLPLFTLMNGKIYNFWQDNKYVKGILRQTSIASFNSGKPKWTTILDVDKLALKEKENWVYKGIRCLDPDYTLCFIQLSRGGKDASIFREFNLKTNSFVKDGFKIPESKSQIAWVNNDLILVGDATDPSLVTDSGYPSQVKILKRGESLKNAKVIFKADKKSMAANVGTKLIDNKRYIYLVDQLSFYESISYLYDINTNQLTKLPIPITANFEGLQNDFVFFSTRERYDKYPAGSLLSFSIKDLVLAKVSVLPVFIPDTKSFYQFTAFSKNHIWVNVLSEVKNRVIRYSLVDNRWVSLNFNLSKFEGNASLSALNDDEEHIYLTYSDFLTPTSVYYYNASFKSQKPKLVLKSPSRFKSSSFLATQHKIKSKDGTIIPYFIIYDKKIKYNSKNPTLLYGYGGFEISMSPAYLGSTGKVWLEKGGVYVLSNIRGGGEYGPEWHRSALRENRHKAYEDFYAIAEDLINRKITSPEHLGIRGGSNGGLLTSVAFTQRPELFNAVISEVPLANMLEYHKWLAGASWMEEYGDPENEVMKKYLASYSPLHNLKKDAKYPEVFYITSTKDDRVSPAHARQMVARMQELGHPVIYNENIDGGHGRAVNMKDLAEFLALEFTYLYQKLF